MRAAVVAAADDANVSSLSTASNNRLTKHPSFTQKGRKLALHWQSMNDIIAFEPSIDQYVSQQKQQQQQ